MVFVLFIEVNSRVRSGNERKITRTRYTHSRIQSDYFGWCRGSKDLEEGGEETR